MFGRGWEPARATVIAREVGQGRLGAKSRVGSSGGAAGSVSYDYVVDVQPSGGGPVFRATFEGPWDQHTVGGFQAPEVGQVVGVKVHAKSGEVKFDTDDRSVYRKGRDVRATERAAFEAAAAGAPAGTSPALAAARATATSAPATDAEMTATDAAYNAANLAALDALAAWKRAGEAGDAKATGRAKAAAMASKQEADLLREEFLRLASQRPDWRSAERST